jgi:hypothetical protein
MDIAVGAGGDDTAGNGAGAVYVFFLQPASLPGDYNQNNAVDAADYTIWRNTLGTVGMPAYSGADGDGDGAIDFDDYIVWKTYFGRRLPVAVAGQGATLTLTEPALKSGPASMPALESIAAPVEPTLDATRSSDWALPAGRFTRQDVTARPRERVTSFRVVEFINDQLLLLLASDRLGHSVQRNISIIDDRGNDSHRADDSENLDHFNEPLALALAEWQ